MVGAFDVVWEVPAEGCHNRGIYFNLSNYDVVTNGGDDAAFDGGNITIFYGDQLGLWPAISGGKFINGGIPQLGNLTAHLAKAKDDIERILPTDFTGLGVMDWESWRITYNLNFDSLAVYQEASINLTRQEHPTWNSSQIDDAARQSFNESAKLWFLSTLQLLKQQRPKGRYGYYEYPLCYGTAADGGCGNQAENDDLQWLWDESGSLFPSNYQHGQPPVNNFTINVAQRVNEAIRVAARSSTSTEVYSYGSIWAGGDFIDAAHVDIQVKTVSQTGADGVVIWGSSSASGNCEGIRDYIASTFGPVAKATAENRATCSEQNCSGHGNCVDYVAPKPDPPPLASQLQLTAGEAAYLDDFYNTANHTPAIAVEGIACRCHFGWSGHDCSQH